MADAGGHAYPPHRDEPVVHRRVPRAEGAPEREPPALCGLAFAGEGLTTGWPTCPACARLLRDAGDSAPPIPR